MRSIILITLFVVFVVFSVSFSLGGCSGGGGSSAGSGGGAETSTTFDTSGLSDEARNMRISYAMPNDTSSALMAVAVSEFGDNISVLDLDGNGNPNRILFTASGGQFGEIALGADGLPTELLLEGYRVTFSGWTENTVDMFVVGPDVSEEAFSVPLSGTRSDLQNAFSRMRAVSQRSDSWSDETKRLVARNIGGGFVIIQQLVCGTLSAGTIITIGGMAVPAGVFCTWSFAQAGLFMAGYPTFWERITIGALEALECGYKWFTSWSGFDFRQCAEDAASKAWNFANSESIVELVAGSGESSSVEQSSSVAQSSSAAPIDEPGEDAGQDLPACAIPYSGTSAPNVVMDCGTQDAAGDVHPTVNYSDPEGDVVSYSLVLGNAYGSQDLGPFPLGGSLRQCGSFPLETGFGSDPSPSLTVILHDSQGHSGEYTCDYY